MAWLTISQVFNRQRCRKSGISFRISKQSYKVEKKNTNWICVTYQIRQLEYSYSIAAQTNTLTSKWARSSSKLSYFFGENYTFGFCWIFLYDFCAGTGPFHTCAHFKGHPKGREPFHPFLTSTQDVWNSDCGKSNITWYRKGVTKT